jgi:hypothetical protein
MPSSSEIYLERIWEWISGGAHVTSSGGGGGASTIANGADVAQGSTTDAPADVVEDGTARTSVSLLKGIKNYLRTMVAGIVLTASELHLGMVSGQGSAVSAEITRPGGATPYAVNDVIGYTAGAALIPFTNIARVNGGTGYIVKARLMTSQKTNVASYRLHLYADNTPTPIADNALFTLLWANRAVRVGYIDLQNMGTEDPMGSDCAVAFTGDIRLHFTTALASRTLYGVLETKSVFTPDAAQVFFIELETELD